MNKLLSQALHFVLEVFDGLDEKLIGVIENNQHLFTSNFIQAASIVWITKLCDLVKLVSKHITVSDIVKVYEEIYLIDPTLNKVCCSLYSKRCLSNTWVAIKEK
jgi:hypothetical protein